MGAGLTTGDASPRSQPASLSRPVLTLASKYAISPPFLAQVVAESVEYGARVPARHQQRHPAVGESRHSPQGRFFDSAVNPNRNRVRWARIDSDAVERMPLVLKGDQFLGRELPKDGDLLLLPGAACMKVFIEGLVFCEARADTDAQPQALA